ncbi:MAG: type IV pilus modification PilV family protein, partial [Acidovorax defluvii]
MNAHYKKPADGFALIEALVAMMVVSFGMLAIAGFQTTLSLNADVAKQRTEATRLAQQKMEDLRTFENLAIYGTQMVSSTTESPIITNASFKRTWGITSAGTPDTGRSVVVTVAWTDRAGNAQQVQLTSHVSATDPLLTGSLWFPLPDGTILRRPKNRNIDIPIPAISITGTGKSYIPWVGGKFLVFSDTSGDIVQKCDVTPTAGNLSACNAF